MANAPAPSQPKLRTFDLPQFRACLALYRRANHWFIVFPRAYGMAKGWKLFAKLNEPRASDRALSPSFTTGKMAEDTGGGAGGRGRVVPSTRLTVVFGSTAMTASQGTRGSEGVTSSLRIGVERVDPVVRIIILHGTELDVPWYCTDFSSSSSIAPGQVGVDVSIGVVDRIRAPKRCTVQYFNYRLA